MGSCGGIKRDQSTQTTDLISMIGNGPPNDNSNVFPKANETGGRVISKFNSTRDLLNPLVYCNWLLFQATPKYEIGDNLWQLLEPSSIKNKEDIKKQSA